MALKKQRSKLEDTVLLMFRIKRENKKKLKKIAVEKDTTMSKIINSLIEEYIKKQGIEQGG